MAAADFKINSSVQADRGYDATTGEAITLQLENAPSVDVYRVEFSVVEQSKDAPAITLSPSNGQPSTPGGTVTFTMPGSGFHSYLIRCKVNNGKRRTERGEVVDADFTQERVIAIRGALTSVRKTVPGERTQYHEDGWSYALDEMAEVVESGAVGSPVTSVGASAPIASSGGSTPTISWNPTAAVGMGGYGFTSCTGVANASGAVTISAGSGNLTLDASAVVQVGGTSATRVELGRSGQTVRHPALAGSGTRYVTVDNNGDEGAAAGSGADATANYVTDSASTVNANDRPAQALPATLEFIRAGGAAIGATHTAAAGSVQTAAYIRRAITGGTSANTGTGVAVEWTVPDGQLTPAVVTIAKERAEWTSLLAGTGTSKLVWSTVNSGSLTDWMTLAGNGNLRLHAYTAAGALVVDASGNVTSTGATPANASRTITAGAGLTGGGDLSADRTLDIVAADGTITVNANSIEASGSFGSKSVLTDNGVDTATGVPLNLGTGNCTDLVLGQAGVPVTVEDALTVGATVTAGTGGFLGVSLDRATSGTFALGATNITALTITPNTTISGTLTERRDNILTTVTPGIIASNTTTTASPSPLVQYGPAFVSSGGAWETGGGGSAKTVRGGLYTRGLSSGTAGAEVVFIYDTGGGSFSEGARVTTNLPGIGGVGLVAATLVCDGGNGIRFVSSGTDRGNVKWSGSAIELNGGSNPITIASTSGTTINTQTITPRVVSAASAPTSSASAVTFNLTTSQNVEHAITENTTVTITGGSRGQRGLLVFTQDGTGRTITMPSASSTIVYDSVLAGLGVTAMVDTTAAARTILEYYITGADKVLIFGRAVLPT